MLFKVYHVFVCLVMHYRQKTTQVQTSMKTKDLYFISNFLEVNKTDKPEKPGNYKANRNKTIIPRE